MTMHDSPLLIRLQGFAFALGRRGAHLRLAQTAASLTFLSLLALVPVISIAISLLGALPMFADLRGAAMRFVASNLFLPNFSDTIIGYLNEFAEKAGSLSAMGAAVFFATAFSALRTIDDTLNLIWEAQRPRPWGRRLTVYWTFLTLGPLLVAASATINTMVLSELIAGVSVPVLETAWVLAVPWLTTMLGLTLLYRLVPNAPVSWRDALIGALFAAVALELLKRGMAMQLSRLPTYTIVYGTFAALPIFFVWIFLLWLTVLAGALVAASLPSWGVRGERVGEASPAQGFDLAFQVLVRLARSMSNGEPAREAAGFRELFGGDPVRASATAAMLAELGYLQRVWRLDADWAQEVHGEVWGELWMLSPGALERTPRALFERFWSGRTRGAAASDAEFDLSLVERPLGESVLR